MQTTACRYLYDRYTVTVPEVAMVHMAACCVAAVERRRYSFVHDANEILNCDGCRGIFSRSELEEYCGRRLCEWCSPKCEVCDSPRLPDSEVCEGHMEVLA